MMSRKMLLANGKQTMPDAE